MLQKEVSEILRDLKCQMVQRLFQILHDLSCNLDLLKFSNVFVVTVLVPEYSSIKSVKSPGLAFQENKESEIEAKCRVWTLPYRSCAP